MNEEEKQLMQKVESVPDSRINKTSDESLSVVERAEMAAKLLKTENDRKEALINIEKEMQARSILGGRANAGQYTPEKTPEELAKEEAAANLRLFGR